MTTILKGEQDKGWEVVQTLDSKISNHKSILLVKVSEDQNDNNCNN